MKILQILFLTAAFAPVCFGQNTNFKVSLTVEAENKQAEEAIRNYISQKLLSLGDVELTETDAYYKLIIAGIGDEHGSGRETKYTLSTVINWRATCEKAERQKRSCYVFDSHFLVQGSAGSLQSLCEKIVARFNSGSLEPLRPPIKP
jgi:hypothetical protein